ncbi:MAG: general secretion pathway protein GspK [Candidatus Omnitrophica bacterium]|nr:general secretion pathway protein GspK [Candidatus Omnitrophota bacterium]
MPPSQMEIRKINSNAQNGSILIFVLSILVLFGVFALTVGHTVRQRLKKIEHLENRTKLRNVAEAGIAQAFYRLQDKPGAKDKFDALNQDWSQGIPEFASSVVGSEGAFKILGGEYELTENVIDSHQIATGYGAIDEERKINLNMTTSPQILTLLLQEAAGLSREDANAVALSVLDWTDADDNPYDRGTESAYYKGLKPPYKTKNLPLGTLEELLLVRGVSQGVYEHLLPYITLHSNGKININTASRVVLKALGMSESLARKVMLIRMGPDGIAGTIDDGLFKDLEAAADTIMKFYPLADEEKASLQSFIGSGILTVYSENFNIRSMANLMGDKNSRMTIDCVMSRKGIVRSWQEYYTTVDKI